MSDDNESRRRRQIPWLSIATLAVTMPRFLLDLTRKGVTREGRPRTKHGAGPFPAKTY
ncbi:MAG: hypothetical protein V4755_07210 [Curtobacterium sp.]